MRFERTSSQLSSQQGNLSIKPKTLKQLSLQDAAYIAGLIDGEGTITLQRRHGKDEFRRLAVTISSTELQILEYVKQALGVGSITTKKKYREHHARSFTYAVHSRQGLSLLEQVHPFLLSYKKERSALLLSDYVRLTPRNGKYSEQQRLARRELEDALLEIKADTVRERSVHYLAHPVASHKTNPVKARYTHPVR